MRFETELAVGDVKKTRPYGTRGWGPFQKMNEWKEALKTVEATRKWKPLIVRVKS